MRHNTTLIITFFLCILPHTFIVSEKVPMIINRTGQDIKVEFMHEKDPLFAQDNTITLTGSSDHDKDQMVLIPSTNIENPQSSENPKSKYQKDATSAKITVNNTTVTIPSFTANSSYVIEPGSSSGSFVATAGLATYDVTSGAASYGSPDPSGPDKGF